MNRLLSTLALLLATTASAAGNLYAVLPTQGVGAAAEAELATRTMTLALQDQSLAMVPTGPMQDALAAQTAACSQSVVACGRLVGTATGATHVIISELWDQAGTLELKVAMLDVRSESPPPWTSWRTENAADLGNLAKRAVLSAVVPDALSGTLSFNQLAAGADIMVDGVARDRTPLISPMKLLEGRHAIEVRVAGKTPWRQTVDIHAGQNQALPVCVRGDAVTSSCSEDARFPILAVAGAATLGVATVSAVVAVVSLFQANAAYDDFASTQQGGNTVRSWQTAAAATGITSGVLALAGAGALVVGFVE